MLNQNLLNRYETISYILFRITLLANFGTGCVGYETDISKNRFTDYFESRTSKRSCWLCKKE